MAWRVANSLLVLRDQVCSSEAVEGTRPKQIQRKKGQHDRPRFPGLRGGSLPQRQAWRRMLGMDRFYAAVVFAVVACLVCGIAFGVVEKIDFWIRYFSLPKSQRRAALEARMSEQRSIDDDARIW